MNLEQNFKLNIESNHVAYVHRHSKQTLNVPGQFNLLKPDGSNRMVDIHTKPEP